MLVVSLLITVAVPHIQKHIRNFSPLIYFVILAVIALGVIMHTSMDQMLEPLVGVSGSSYVILSDGGVAQVSGSEGGKSYSAGTYIMFIVIALAAVVYAFRVLFKNVNASMIAFMIVVTVAALGLIFNPDMPAQPDMAAAAQAPPTGMDAYAPAFFALETVTGAGDVGAAVAKTTYTVITISGVILLASLIILVMLPQVTIRTKKIAMFLFAAAVAVFAIGALFFDDFDKGYLTSSLSGELYAVILVGVGLFVLTGPLVHTKITNSTNMFIVSLGVLALISVYFFTEPNQGANQDAAVSYAAPVIATGAAPKPPPAIEYDNPVRLDEGAQGMAIYAQFAYSAIIVVLLHIFLSIAMVETSFRSFWRYWHIVALTMFVWSSLFYALGVPLWHILAVIGVAVISAPNILHIIGTYRTKQRLDASLSQWSG